MSDPETPEVEYGDPPDTGGFSSPHGPQIIEVPTPGGAFKPLFGASYADEPRPETPKVTWADVVDEDKVLCFGCKFGWIMWKHAPTRNLKPDGSPFIQREGYCLFPAQNPGGAPLPLSERFVLRCNVHSARPDEAVARDMAQQPHKSGDDIDEPEWAGKPAPKDDPQEKTS